MTLGGNGPPGIYKTKEKYIIFYKFFEFGLKKIVLAPPLPTQNITLMRSEERRVGKECA